MANVRSGLSKFPWKRKSREIQGTCWGLEMHTRLWGVICHWRFIFYFSTWNSSLRSWAQWATNTGKSFTRIFPHGAKICRKVVTEHVSWLLLEPYWRGVYCQLQTKELQKGVLKVSKVKHVFSYFCCVIARSYVLTSSLPLILNSLRLQRRDTSHTLSNLAIIFTRLVHR